MPPPYWGRLLYALCAPQFETSAPVGGWVAWSVRYSSNNTRHRPHLDCVRYSGNNRQCIPTRLGQYHNRHRNRRNTATNKHTIQAFRKQHVIKMKVTRRKKKEMFRRKLCKRKWEKEVSGCHQLEEEEEYEDWEKWMGRLVSYALQKYVPLGRWNDGMDENDERKRMGSWPAQTHIVFHRGWANTTIQANPPYQHAQLPIYIIRTAKRTLKTAFNAHVVLHVVLSCDIDYLLN